ncbi:class I SAM-dependent DNA methyltransferase [Catenisphaera adipataccumulans]|jgi:SAM-dependent methyltransferase|uniref:SAM-dependent methyltransferase n=1 Tax=Catenisphaera adipataccumulans TaxID=700500 RepID=A0A7W8CXJ5_9FIRM|nr:class I SAM-dependent methyltransferase [Catenisphaera adipataccumulans]MBB5183480.1 SAM-dependent methyltransferase [Catenisphaera adipataccumulans]
MYNRLASYYDDLVQDDEATQAWVSWIESYTAPGPFLELACGSGEITRRLAQDGFDVTALDLSPEMISRAAQKCSNVRFLCQDMTRLENLPTYPAIGCFCDSFNYLIEPEEVQAFFHQVHDHLKTDGLFLFDTHALDRLTEFQNEWNETGRFTDGTDYQWSIESEDDWIYQDFAFYLPDGQTMQEHHLQRVYQPEDLSEWAAPWFDLVDVRTDFDQKGIVPGEKYFYVLRRKNI